MRNLFLSICFLLVVSASAFAQATSGPTAPGAVAVVNAVERSDSATNVCHTHATGVTCTLTAGAAGTSTQSIYITGIDVGNCEGATTVTVANPTYITTTGINGSPQFQVGSGPGTSPGVCSPISNISFTAPLKSATPGTNVTFVMPSFITNQTVSLNVYYRLGY